MSSGKRQLDFIRDSLLSRRDAELIRGLSCDASFGRDAGILTSDMVVDNESSMYLLALGVIGFQRGWEHFPESVIPRIRGIHRYYQVNNGASAPWLKDKLARLRAEDIPVMLTGGSAMRAVYAAGTPRMMYGCDMTVPSGSYEKATGLLRDAVREADLEDPAGRTIAGHTMIRLHEGVPDKRLFAEKSLWNAAKEALFLEQEVLVPSPEDMIIHLLCIPYPPWTFSEGRNERVRRLAECCLVMRGGFDPEALSERADKAGLKDPVAMYLKLLSETAPDALCRTDFEEYFPSDEDYLRYERLFFRLAKAFGGPENSGEASSENDPGVIRKIVRRFSRRKILGHLDERRRRQESAS